MAAIVNDDTQSIVVGSGSDRVAINLKQAPTVSDVLQMQFVSLFCVTTGSNAIVASHIDSH